MTSIRFFAALHLLLFHMYAIGGPEMKSGTFDAMYEPLRRMIERGYYSTSLFFLLSGFALAYVYIGADRRMTVGRRDFWIARFARIYPLHLLVLALLSPIILMTAQGLLDVLAGGIFSSLLIQAWIPAYALSWNFPTWALSVVAFFYLMFPLIVATVGRMTRRQMAILLAVLPVVSLIPAVLFYAAGGPHRFPALGFWNEFLTRSPVLWLPHFVMGVLLSCLFGVHRHSDQWRDAKRRPVAWGDLAFLCICVLLVTDQTWTFRGTTYSSLPRLIMHNGALAPLYLVLIHDLARNRGLLSRVLDWRAFRAGGNASFSIFILQVPVLTSVALFGHWGLSAFPLMQLAMAAVLCVVLALLSRRYFETPIARYIRSKCVRESATSAPKEYAALAASND